MKKEQKNHLHRHCLLIHLHLLDQSSKEQQCQINEYVAECKSENDSEFI